jgi:hypothetical protein
VRIADHVVVVEKGKARLETQNQPGAALNSFLI